MRIRVAICDIREVTNGGRAGLRWGWGIRAAHRMQWAAVMDISDGSFVSWCRKQGLLAGSHYARYIDKDVPMHVISRVIQGRYLLRPCTELNEIINGVVGRAQERYKNVLLYAMAFMSNHAHFMLQGPPEEVPAFIGFVKREISYRWGRARGINWPGPMWHEYIASALPTAESQVLCLRYVLSQGVKEGLVARAQEWPGVHCAGALAGEAQLQGVWFDGTAFARAMETQSRRARPVRLAKGDFQRKYEVRFSAIPAWADLDVAMQRSEVRRLLDEIEREGEVARAGRPPMGRRRICRIPLDHRSELPEVPWYRRRRRLVCWASPHAPETKKYIADHRAFQEAFIEASKADAEGRAALYPPGAFVPCRIARRTADVRLVA